MTIDRQFQKKVLPAGGDQAKYAPLSELVPKVRKLGNDNFTQHIVVKNHQLRDQLALAEGKNFFWLDTLKTEQNG